MLVADRPVCVSTAYLPPVEYLVLWMHAPAFYIEQHEYFEKQSYRNRCRIAASAGTMELTIPVERCSGNRTPIGEVLLSDHGNWAQQHWKAIESAYQSSPFFEYMADELKAIYDRPGVSLWDFNWRLMEWLASWLEIDKPLLKTEAFQAVPGDALVLRQLLHPKRPALLTGFPVYYQVFASKTGFAPNLSTLDLLMNCGKEAILYLNSFKNHKFSVIL